MNQLDAVVGHHMSRYASGVAKFNQMIATELGIAHLTIADERAAQTACPLLSFKVAELDPPDIARVENLLDRLGELRVFFHEYRGHPLEQRLAETASLSYCGNDEIVAALAPLGANAVPSCSPATIIDRRAFKPATLNVFSFGMAHKVRVEMFARLRDLLDATGETYAVYMSNANHASATLREAEEVHAQMDEIFSHDFYFMGNLSDVAISNHLRSATFFAAFFDRGVRANNSTVVSAMEHGVVVITNLDEHSPPAYRHMDNVIDITQTDVLPSDPLVLARMRVRAMETAEAFSWPPLLDQLRAPAVSRTNAANRSA